ncbi:hypothetical protein K3495_g5338 [Podosphaera aphanis]|nr:hypothetical protein K3495_g5338 [Podosphaera aphanis]
MARSNQPKLAHLKTRMTCTYPSELSRSPHPDLLKGDALKTPITPPAAYLEFLEKYSGKKYGTAAKGNDSVLNVSVSKSTSAKVKKSDGSRDDDEHRLPIQRDGFRQGTPSSAQLSQPRMSSPSTTSEDVESPGAATLDNCTPPTLTSPHDSDSDSDSESDGESYSDTSEVESLAVKSPQNRIRANSRQLREALTRSYACMRTPQTSPASIGKRRKLE